MGCKAKKRLASAGQTAMFLFCINLVYFLPGCATLEPFGKVLSKSKLPAEWGRGEKGWASFYHPTLSGRKTASGEVYLDELYTAAHPTLPFGTIVLVRRVATGRYAFLRINDRGPFVKGRVIDLSRAAAARLGLVAAGVGKVEVFVIPPEHPLIVHL
jgi:rare lipoprotein A (peptidoglycan hydrolase)